MTEFYRIRSMQNSPVKSIYGRTGSLPCLPHYSILQLRKHPSAMKGSVASTLAAVLHLYLVAPGEGFHGFRAYGGDIFIPSGIQSGASAFAGTRARLVTLADSSSESKGDVNVYPDSRRKIAELKIKVDSNLSKDVMNVAMLKESIRDMEEESSQPGFWDSQEKAQDLLTEMNRVKALVARVEYWKTSVEDIDLLLDMAAEDPNEAGKSLKQSKLFFSIEGFR